MRGQFCAGPSHQTVSHMDYHQVTTSSEATGSHRPLYNRVYPSLDSESVEADEGTLSSSEDVKSNAELHVASIQLVSEDRVSGVPCDVDMIENIKIEVNRSPCSDSSASDSYPQDSVADTSTAAQDGVISIPLDQLSGALKLRLLPSVCEENVLHFKPSDIYCAGVTGLFFKCLPNKLRSLIGIKCIHGELTHERITLLLSTNLDGSEKLPPLCIGSPDNGRCLRDVVYGPVNYKCNLKSWLTPAVFTSWLRKLDAHFQSQGRRVLLIINDIFESSTEEFEPSAINMIYLQTNEWSRSSFQPCDHGIIRQFKLHYRYHQLKNYTAHLEHWKNSGSEEPCEFEWSVQDALFAIRQSWRQVEPRIIWEAFDSAEFPIPQIPNQNSQTGDVEVKFERLMAMLNSIVARKFSPVAYLSVDAELVIRKLPMAPALNIRYFNKCKEQPAGPSVAEVKRALNVVRRFAGKNFSNGTDVKMVYDATERLGDLVDKHVLRGPRQTSILEYLQ